MRNAILLDPKDNVVTVLFDLAGGDAARWEGGEQTAAEPVPSGHKLAIAPIRAGQTIFKYGEEIGTATRDIAPGDWVHVHNLGIEVFAQ